MRAKGLIVGFLVIISSSAYAQGALKGRVSFEGAAPPIEKIEVRSDVPVCGDHKEVPRIILGKDRGVANAVVKILGAKGTPALKKGGLDQVKCEFVPHAQVLPTGSTLVITSSDSVLHNSHGFYEDGSTAFNIAVPIVGMEISKKLEKPGIIRLRCDAGHTWMSAYVVVLDEPFYALTDADGNFAIEGVPAGNYEMEVWQEWLGGHREPVSVKENETTTVNVALKKNLV